MEYYNFSFVPTDLSEIKLDKIAENKCKLVSQKQGINFVELPCIVPELTLFSAVLSSFISL